MSSKGELQHTPSDNKKGQAQNINMKGGNNPTSSGSDFGEIRKEAFESRESGLNESGKKNRPVRNDGKKDSDYHIET